MKYRIRQKEVSDWKILCADHPNNKINGKLWAKCWCAVAVGLPSPFVLFARRVWMMLIIFYGSVK